MGLSRFALLLLPVAGMAQAQAIKNEPPLKIFSEEEIAAVAMPSLSFVENDKAAADYDKYFYFHRPATNFDRAFADVTECDALSSGLSYYRGADSSAVASAMSQYGVLAGGLGGAIGGLMADAIFGSAERRKQRRMNIRNCMFYKGYDRYGLEKDLWQEFNFEEGLSREEADKRKAALMMQARVASGPKPDQEVLAP